MKPFFQHHCDQCQFIGQAVVNDKKVDFYACGKTPKETTLLFRTGDEAPDYGSTRIDYVSALSWEAMLAFGLYLRHLNANSARGSFVRGEYFNGSLPVLNLEP